jgi:hypothetical protein
MRARNSSSVRGGAALGCAAVVGRDSGVGVCDAAGVAKGRGGVAEGVGIAGVGLAGVCVRAGVGVGVGGVRCTVARRSREGLCARRGCGGGAHASSAASRSMETKDEYRFDAWSLPVVIVGEWFFPFGVMGCSVNETRSFGNRG